MNIITEQDFTRIMNSANGNPRYVCHYLSLIKKSDSATANKYNDALSFAKPIGGKKHHTKSYGGGVVFETYNLGALCEFINEELQK